jgi:hypothetical protein
MMANFIQLESVHSKHGMIQVNCRSSVRVTGYKSRMFTIISYFEGVHFICPTFKKINSNMG